MTRTLLTPVIIALAVAAVVAFVVVVLVRGGGATPAPLSSGPGGRTPSSTGPSVSVPAVSRSPVVPPVKWSSVAPTMSCGGVGSVVDARAVGDLNGDGRPDAVISAHCDAGAGSPPSTVEVYLDSAGRARHVGHLATVSNDLLVRRLAIGRGLITLTAQGYSPGTPRCCPDRAVKQVWRVTTTAGTPALIRVH